MTHEVAPAVFVIHEVAAVREAIQGGNAAMNSIIGPIFVTPCLVPPRLIYFSSRLNCSPDPA
jgi:hypothetical protein